MRTTLSLRSVLRRFTLGSGPLKRRSDRVEFVSRLFLVLARQRSRRWETGWQQVEPLWISRFW